MAVVSLFWNTNIAAVSSCENALYRPHILHPKAIRFKDLFPLLNLPINEFISSVYSLKEYMLASSLTILLLFFFSIEVCKKEEL